jgi:hypothetical protein
LSKTVPTYNLKRRKELKIPNKQKHTLNEKPKSLSLGYIFFNPRILTFKNSLFLVGTDS